MSESELLAQVAKLKAQLRGVRSDTNATIKQLTRELEMSEARNAWISEAALADVKSKPIRPRSKKADEGAFFLGASDWHIGEVVLPSDTNLGNEFDERVQRRRSEAFFVNAAKLVHQYRKCGLVIQQAVLWLGGDMVTGELHGIRTSEPVIKQGRTLTKLLRSGIEWFLNDTKLERVQVLCNYGNHGRTTEERKITRGADYSYEWLCYHHLCDIFEGEKRLEWVIANNPFLYTDVYGHTVCTSHGDAPVFSGGGGAAGVVGKVMKGISKLKKPADYTVVGHYHTYVDFGSGTVNGSLKGYDEYAEGFGFPDEKPQQASSVMLKGSRPTWRVFRTPVFCD